MLNRPGAGEDRKEAAPEGFKGLIGLSKSREVEEDDEAAGGSPHFREKASRQVLINRRRAKIQA
jgi:hypothetical protein